MKNKSRLMTLLVVALCAVFCFALLGCQSPADATNGTALKPAGYGVKNADGDEHTHTYSGDWVIELGAERCSIHAIKHCDDYDDCHGSQYVELPALTVDGTEDGETNYTVNDVVNDEGEVVTGVKTFSYNDDENSISFTKTVLILEADGEAVTVPSLPADGAICLIKADTTLEDWESIYCTLTAYDEDWNVCQSVGVEAFDLASYEFVLTNPCKDYFVGNQLNAVALEVAEDATTPITNVTVSLIKSDDNGDEGEYTPIIEAGTYTAEGVSCEDYKGYSVSVWEGETWTITSVDAYIKILDSDKEWVAEVVAKTENNPDAEDTYSISEAGDYYLEVYVNEGEGTTATFTVAVDTDDNTGGNTGENPGENTGNNNGDNTGDNTGNNNGDNTGDNTGNNNDNNGNNNTTENKTDDGKKSGCGSNAMASATGAAAVLMLAAGATILLRKKSHNA